MNLDTNSDISVLYSISQLNNPNIETPDEFADSQSSPSNNFQTNSSVFSKPPFQPIPINNPLPSVSTPSYASQCNIRPEDTYRRITKLSLKTTG